MEVIEAPAMASDTRALKLTQFLADYPDVWSSKDAAQYHLKNRKSNGLLATGAVVEQRSKPDQERASLFIVPAKLHAYLSGQRINELSAGDELIARQLEQAIERMTTLEARLSAVTEVLERRV